MANELDSIIRPYPPMEPLAGSTRWITTSSAVLDGDLSLPTLVIRLGAACNALIAQQIPIGHAMKDDGAASKRGLLWSFITSASFAKESITMLTGQKGVPPESDRVKTLAIKGGAPEELVKTIGHLCGGSHPACPILARVRNQMGFHWDPILVEIALQDFRKNQQLLWIEAKDESTCRCFLATLTSQRRVGTCRAPRLDSRALSRN